MFQNLEQVSASFKNGLAQAMITLANRALTSRIPKEYSECGVSLCIKTTVEVLKSAISYHVFSSKQRKVVNQFVETKLPAKISRLEKVEEKLTKEYEEALSVMESDTKEEEIIETEEPEASSPSISEEQLFKEFNSFTFWRAPLPPLDL